MDTGKIVNINVDVGKIAGDLKHTWRYIGYDECNYTHSPEGEELIAKFGSLSDGPYYIRAHHLFCTGNCHGTYKWGSTNVYTEDDAGKPIYDFNVIDEILDIYLRNNCKPFFELGFMPMDLVDTTVFTNVNEWDRYGKYKAEGWSYPPKDYIKWYDLIFSVVKHCVDRYGEREVLSWYWELWNEPDIPYWKGTTHEYCMLFDFTEAAIHNVLKNARIGGPSTTGPAFGSKSLLFLEEFLNHCANGINYFSGEKGTRLDFVTFHTKGGGFPFKINAEKTTPSVKSLVKQVETGLEAVKTYGFGDCEIVLSEADPDGWAAGGRFDNMNMNFRNTEYYASFVASGYHNIEKAANAMDMDVRPLAWAFMFNGERCFEGTRTFSTQGIDKPVLNLFKIFAKMGDRRLFFESSGEKEVLTFKDDFGSEEQPEVTGIASISRDGSVQVLIYSHHDDWDVEKEFDVDLTIKNIFISEKVNIQHYRIDKNHSNAYEEWIRQGKPNYPSKEQYENIKSKDALELFKFNNFVDISENRISMRFMMPTHAVSLLIITKE